MTPALMDVQLWASDLRERAVYDWRSTKALIGGASLAGGLGQVVSGRVDAGFDTLARTHRADLWGPADSVIERLCRSALSGNGSRVASKLRHVISDYPARLRPDATSKRFFDSPGSLFPSSAMVLKSPSADEKGVLYLYYTSRYHVVAEPSWSGYCDLNVLTLDQLGVPVFVGAIEPRDAQFLRSVSERLLPVSVSSNTWVDPRVFRPLPDVRKDIDVIIVAGWAQYKRHWAVFRALRALKQAGQRLRVALVGYPISQDREAILGQARHYGVDDLLEVHEKLTAEQVNLLFNRSRVNVLWSRREGVNRAIIEGMAAGLPCIVRRGFNYGHAYEYINPQTGRFVTEAELPAAMSAMVRDHARYAPREWILPRMTPEASAARLSAEMRDYVQRSGGRWTRDLVPKVNTLNGLHYWNPADAERFDADHAELRSLARRPD
jgi:glycosyltransferase involved in cell wall biosynthesis